MNLKTGVSRKQSMPDFPKNELSLIRSRTCGYHGVRNVSFSENLACFVFLKHSLFETLLLMIIYRPKKPETSYLRLQILEKIHMKGALLLYF